MTMIRHIPHDSTLIPSAYRDSFLLDDANLQQEVLRMTDLHLLDLFGGDSTTDVVFPVSRLLVDVERFEDDSEEPMAARGMGVCYTSTHDLKPLRRPLTEVEKEALLTRFYRPHHALLEQRVEELLARNRFALLIDCHSFPSCRLPYEIGPEGDRPEICIGTDRFHTPEAIALSALKRFASQGYSVGLNAPFAGALTPMKYYRKDARVISLMIEVRRDLYMDEATGERTERFEQVRQQVQEVMDELAEGCLRLMRLSL